MPTQQDTALPAKSGKPSATSAKLGRNRLQEAQAAVHFWQALEYLAPQSPPKVSPNDFVWELDAKSLAGSMPWRDHSKLAILKGKHPKWRFQIFSGIADGRSLIEEARAALGALPLNLEERRPPGAAACVVLEVNGNGMATGDVFVSTVPWAMAHILEQAGKTTPIDFRGFFGTDGRQEQIQLKIRDLLVERKLLRSAESGAQMPPASPAGAPAIDGPVENKGPALPVAGAADQPAPAPADELRAVTADDIEAADDLVFDLCGWRPKQQGRWRVKAIMEAQDGGKKASDDPLNSFYAEDLERLGDALACNNIGAGLRAYLQGEDSPGRTDLERHVDALITGVHPSQLPPGAWPAEHPLVTAQQFAVNTIKRELSHDNGIFSVNGPPGTGKTTMLKDIVAAAIVQRADVLATYTNPEAAFGKQLLIDRYDYSAYELDKQLCGFGIVVASALNGAVENISKELPGLAAIAQDIELDYFSDVADSIAAPAKASKRNKQERWGLIAAVLGNKENRGNFARRFWFAEMADMKARAKAKEAVEAPDPQRLRSIQSVIASGDHGALPWREAKKRYEAARKTVQTLLNQADDMAEVVIAMDAARQRRLACAEQLTLLTPHTSALQGVVVASVAALNEAEKGVVAARERHEACRALAQQQELAAHKAAELAVWHAKLPQDDLRSLRVAHERAVQRCQELDQQYDKHIERRPGQIAQIFNTAFSKRWNEAGTLLEAEIAQAKSSHNSAAELVATTEALMLKIAASGRACQAAREELARAQAHAIAAGVGAGAGALAGTLDNQHQSCKAKATRLKQDVVQAKAALDALLREIAECRGAIADADTQIAARENAVGAFDLDERTLASWRLAQLDRDSLHRAAPYTMEALFIARRELFVAAMDLHKSFIVASWPKLRPTLSAFINLLTGTISPGQVHKGPIALWDAFFLVVPLISTTFASFPRLFAGVGREELAWLLIDEAGQATPQQAAGAIWRSRRSVVVGDPLQLEPVVGVPDELITPLLTRCATEKQWAPPAASAQVLADRANRYGTYLGEGDERVWLGSPLVVHRRCLDPMFSISNRISYDGLMVYGAGNGDLRSWRSSWIDIPARGSEGHWVDEQGSVALELVQSITKGILATNGQHKVYIITPFRKVAEKIKNLLWERYKGASNGMSGTVHTFQGKEADNVIFLLGGDPSRPGVITSFAGAKPNLVNVAVTRARRRLYVIGDHQYWTGPNDIHGIFQDMADLLPLHSASAKKEGAAGGVED